MSQPFQFTSGPTCQAARSDRKYLNPCHYDPHNRSSKVGDLRYVPPCRQHHDLHGQATGEFRRSASFRHADFDPDIHPLLEIEGTELMITRCTNCESIFRDVDRNEDGSPSIESERCCNPGFEVYLCVSGCLHLSFFCEGCRSRFCGEHKVSLEGLELCADCAIRVVEDKEPECECSQSDADLFDAASCEIHNPNSSWNVRLRTATALQKYSDSAAEL
jgi:hypothetical protein